VKAFNNGSGLVYHPYFHLKTVKKRFFPQPQKNMPIFHKKYGCSF